MLMAGMAHSQKPSTCGPVPTGNQLRWQDMEMYAFIHYSLNTYTDQEWGFGNEDLQLFNPSDLDCRQWARVCKQAGMKGIIFTAKHHCGFCMWPSKYTEYSVKNTPWKQGKGDVVRELAEACKEEGLEYAVYLSPWDRNHPDYGKPEYVTYFRNQLRELLTEYGDMFEVWFDGANGGDGWYGGANEVRKIDRTTYYQWPETYHMIRELQPKCLIWNDGSDRGDLRWVGTEAGNVGETNWSLLNDKGDVPYEQLHYGVENGNVWVPGETNTSIRPGWFYHETENESVKSLSKLMDTYYKSVGRNSCLLLNFPIMPNGRIHPTDSLRGIAFNKMIHEVFKEDLIDHSSLTIDHSAANNGQCLMFNVQWDKPTSFNRFVVEEDIRYGQRVKKFSLEAEVDGKWVPLRDELVEQGDGLTTIGHRRIVCFPTVKATRLRFTVLDTKCEPIIKRMSVYLAPDITPDTPDAGEKHASDYYIFFGADKMMFVNLNEEQTVTAFRYLPPQESKEGLVTHYRIAATTDWKTWVTLGEGEFSNIVNNPIWQTVRCKPTRAKVIRVEGLRLAQGERMGYSDVEVVTSTDDEAWNESVWICVADAQEVTGRVNEDTRAADGANWFVSSITNEKKVVKALWMTTSLGVNELYVNGQRIGREVLRPGFSHHSRTKYSFTYDVTKQFQTKKGRQNTLAAQVTPGWWADKIITPSGSNGMYGQKCAFRGVLELTFSDGTKRRYGTNTKDWKAGIAGPVVHAAIFDGEEYDARIPLGFNTSHKLSTPAISKEYKGIIVPENGAEVYHLEELVLSPRRAYVYSKVDGATGDAYGKIVIDREYKDGQPMTIRPGEHLVIDFGQNCAAVPSFRFRAKEGTHLTCLPAELLNDGNGAKSRGMDGPEGSIHRRNLRIHQKSIRLDYTFAEEKSQISTFTPLSTFFGYRYVDITATDEVVIERVQSVPVSSITPAMETGHITTGNDLINQLISNTIWGMRSNYLSVPTDCPQRNERLGWTADTQVFAETGSYFADTRRFFHKWLHDLRDSQNEEGGYPSVAPPGQYGSGRDEYMRFGWSDAGIIVPWTIWKQFGDTTIIEEHWESMKRYMDHVNATKYDHKALSRENGNYQWGDWLSYEALETCGRSAFKGNDPLPETIEYWNYLGASYWAVDAAMMADMAKATGRDGSVYSNMANAAKDYLRERFFNADAQHSMVNGQCSMFKCDILNTMQTPALFALRNHLFEGEAKDKMIERLRENFRQHGDCLQTGFLGTSILMPTLTDNGMADVAYTLLFQRKNPSWLYSVDNGATTIWERWNSYMKENGMGPNGMNSFNHYAYGCVCQWLWQTCAGIASDPAQPGFKHIIMKPVPDCRLGHLDAVYSSAAGTVESHWKYEGEEWIWTFTIPEGATATVTLPGESETKEYSSGTYTLRK